MRAIGVQGSAAFGRGAPAGRADDDPARDGDSAERRADQGAREGSAPAQANCLLGQIALFRGRLDEAITLTEREIAINPATRWRFSQLGDAYVRQAQWDEGIAALQKSIWLNPFYSAPTSCSAGPT